MLPIGRDAQLTNRHGQFPLCLQPLRDFLLKRRGLVQQLRSASLDQALHLPRAPAPGQQHRCSERREAEPTDQDYPRRQRGGVAELG